MCAAPGQAGPLAMLAACQSAEQSTLVSVTTPAVLERTLAGHECMCCRCGSGFKRLQLAVQEALFAYLHSVGALPAHAQVADMELLQFGHGQSNPTYLVQVWDLACIAAQRFVDVTNRAAGGSIQPSELPVCAHNKYVAA